ncbi:ATP-binding protein [Corynebacterium cystitidis]|uniref:ATP-binding protein n=1 Tax=Corynebacterium cystitidis TaxID=35757 RepID=UPI0038BA5462
MTGEKERETLPSTEAAEAVAQTKLPEDVYKAELADLVARKDSRPPGWKLSPESVVDFVCGDASGSISPKFIGERSVIERCVVTLLGSRGLMLVGEPGTAKSMLSELLAAAISGTSTLTVQGSAGTTEDQLRYGWNYALLLAEGPSMRALVPSAVMAAMTSGAIARVEEITRCQPEVQDALVPVLSERRIAVPELGQENVAARPGFAVIATANLRDRGVSEMSAALKRRFNFEQIDPIADRAKEISLVDTRTKQALEDAALPQEISAVDQRIINLLVTIVRDLRRGVTEEGWGVEKPSTVMSTAEAASIASSMILSSRCFGSGGRDRLSEVPAHLLGAVRKDNPDDAAVLRTYWDAVVRRRAEREGVGSPWSVLWDQRHEFA